MLVKVTTYLNREVTDKRLCLLIGYGMLLRCLVVLWYSPLESKVLDPVRHLTVAKDLAHPPFMSMLDPPIYQWWLSCFARFFQDFPLVAVLYSLVMVLVTPFTWYLWMRLCLQDKRWALAGLVIFTYLPSYLTIYCFFMPETLLLPLVGLSLWLTDKTAKDTSNVLLAATAFLWGVTVATKLTALVTCLLSLGWLWWKLAGVLPRWRLCLTALSQLLIVVTLYALVPMRIYNDLHVFEWEPGMQAFNRVMYESGKTRVDATIRRFDSDGKIHEYPFWCDSPGLSGQRCQIFRPFSNWTSDRQGTERILVDYTKGHPIFPQFTLSWKDRLRYTFENMLFFFFNSTYPEDWTEGFVYDVDTAWRWLWFPLFVSTLALALYRRIWTEPVVLSTLTALFVILQQSNIVEGRYRKAWEGLAIVAMLDVLRKTTGKSQAAPSVKVSDS